MTISPSEAEYGSTPSQGDAALLNEIAHIRGQLDRMERFFSRRFDEVAAEVNATSQQVGMVEDGLVERFTGIVEIVEAITHSGDGKTPANAGVELDAVVDMTEKAAEKILDAAGRISSRLAVDINWMNDDARRDFIKAIHQDVEEIYLACSFQDITGQRIRNTLGNLKLIEQRLNGALDKLGIQVDTAANPHLDTTSVSSQDDIDALFD